MTTLSPEVTERIAIAVDFEDVGGLDGYWTRGGSYMLASTASLNDDGEPHDLLMVTRFGQVLALGPTTSTEFHAEVVAIIDRARVREEAR